MLYGRYPKAKKGKEASIFLKNARNFQERKEKPDFCLKKCAAEAGQKKCSLFSGKKRRKEVKMPTRKKYKLERIG